jgi:c-di-GMP-binding flagellar brake protein YcgR
MKDNSTIAGIPDIILRPLSDEQAEAAEKLLPQQRRRARRVATYTRIDVRACPTSTPLGEEQAVLCDISAFGAGLIVKRPMKVGEQFLIRLASAHTDMLYRVVRCQLSRDSCYAVGAEYLCVAVVGENGMAADEAERIQRFILQ